MMNLHKLIDTTEIMNEQLQNFARQTLKDGLAQLPEDWQYKFKLMYGRVGGKRSMEVTKLMSIEMIVNDMPYEKLDWAMVLVENSIRKLASRKQDPVTE
jgi:hypothetical protein